MKIRIYDIDGTLTKVKGDNLEPDPFENYAFWPLLTYQFAKDPAALKAAVEEWDKSDKGVGEAFINTSQDMLQRGLDHFRPEATGLSLRDYAKEITLQFIDHNIIQSEGIEHLDASLKAEDVCILSTGSYQDGAIGFVQALMERKLLSPDALDKLVISGAVIDWGTRQVVHANIAENKIKGLVDACKAQHITFDPTVDRDSIAGIYVDDPLGNDSGLCALHPEQVHLIRTFKNKDKALPPFQHEEWSDILRKENGSRFALK